MATPPASPARAPVLLLRLAGVAVVEGPHAAVPLAPQAAAMLAWLALEGPTPRMRLAQLIWPDSAPEAARNSLRQRLFQLKKAFEPGLVDGQATLSLSPQVMHDLLDSDDVLGGTVVEIGGEFADWLAQQRRRRRQRMRQSLVELAEMAERAGDWGDALMHAQELVAAEPLSEDAHRRVMRLHYLSGDSAAALIAFDRCERVLKDEVGARPSAQTLALLATVEAAAKAVPAVVSTVPASVLRPPRLIGRDAEWAGLHANWSGSGVVLLEGEGGLGKSRLLADFAAARGAAQGRVLIVGARPGDATLPYGVLGRGLRALLPGIGTALPAGVRSELARLLPELGDARPMAADASRTRFVHAVEAAFDAAQAAGLEGLLIDDLHLADDASSELLVQLAAHDRLRWLFAYRGAELRGSARVLIESLQAARRAPVLQLAPLGVAQIAEMLESLGLVGFGGQAQALQLHRHSGGNPMFLLETVRALLARTAADVPAAGSALPALPSASQVILRRITQLSPQAVKLARCAAIAGQDFSAALASAVLHVPPLDLADAWNELEAAQVLRDGAFAHDLIYEAALASVPVPIARELHRLIAADLESRDCEAARVASHWVAGGDALRAVPHLRRAAQLALQRFRYAEAAATFAQAGRICAESGDRASAFDLHFAAADAIATLGDPSRLAGCVEELEALAADDAQVARAALPRSVMELEAGRLDGSRGAALRGLEPARRAGLQDVESELLYVVGVVHWERREVAAAISHVEQALELRRRLPPHQQGAEHLSTLITVMQSLSAMQTAAGHFAQSQSLALECHRLATEAQRAPDLIAPAASLCLMAADRGLIDESLEWARRGLRAGDAAEVNAVDLSRLEMMHANTLLLAGQWGAALDQYERLQLRFAGRASWRYRGDFVHRFALMHFVLGRRDLVLKGLQAGLADEGSSATQRLWMQVLMLAIGERGDAAVLLDRIVALDDIGMRTRLLVRLAAHGDAPALLPVLAIAAGTVRDGGLDGLWLSLQVKTALLLARAGRHDEAADLARLAWQRSEAGCAASHPFVELAADLCAALAALDPAMAGQIGERGRRWLNDAAGTLPPEWRDNCVARHPFVDRLARGTV